MKHRIAAAFICLLTAQTVSAQIDSYLGVYIHPRPVLTIEGEHVGFVPLQTMNFEVSVGNEEGPHEIFLTDGIEGSVEFEMELDGLPVPVHRMIFEWSTDPVRVALDDELPPEPSVPGVIESGVGLTTTVSISPPNAQGWYPGDYVLRLRFRPAAVRLGNGDTWSGRGGMGETRFTLRDEISTEDQLLARKLEAKTALDAGRLRDAAGLWRSITQTHPDDLDAWAGLGVATFHLGDHQKAADCLQRVMPATPGDMPRSTLPLLLAESYVHLGDLESAAAALRHIVPEADISAQLESIQSRVAGTQ